MAILTNLPDLDQAAASFLTEFALLLQGKVNQTGDYGPSDTRLRAVAEWGDFVDGALVSLQADYAERRLSPGIVRVGDSRIYRVTATPEGNQSGSPGDIALRTDGSVWLKVTGSATTTGWSAIGGTGADAGGPTVAQEIDYTAEANATLADGVVSLGGVSHTVQNDANASLFSIVNGTGVRIDYKTSGAGSTVMNATNNAPGVYAELGDIVPNHSEANRYMFMWHYSLRGSFDSGDGVGFFLQQFDETTGSFYEGTPQDYAWGGYRAFVSGASQQPAWALIDATSFVVYRTEMYAGLDGGTDEQDRVVAGATEWNVLAIKQINPGKIALYAGQYDTDWPDLADLRLIGIQPYDAEGNEGGANLRNTHLLAGLVGPAGAASPHGVDIHRLRILDLGA